MMMCWKRGRAALLSAGALLGGCAGAPPPEVATPQAGLVCVDDSADCIAKRKVALNSLISDPKRAWIKEPATAEAHATGVRMFAYKKKKKELTCEELAQGRKEADAAPDAMRSAGKLLTTTQVARGAMFATEVGRELTTEYNRRCK